jgi:hypothetical protein
MTKHRSRLTDGLRTSLEVILADRPSPAQANDFVLRCHALAMEQVRRWLAASRFSQTSAGLQPADIAFDCIAELFSQTAEGEFTVLRSYFACIPWRDCSDEALLSSIRRLVMTSVNDGIFRIYQEHDPSLAKILRNIKLTIRSFHHFDEIDRFGEPHIAPVSVDLLSDLDPLDEEHLERILDERLLGTERIPEMLSKLARYLQEERHHIRLVPLVPLALAFRNVVMRKALPPVRIADEINDKDPGYQSVMEQTILRACKHVRRKTASKYISQKKLSHELVDAYFEVIQKKLSQTLVVQDGMDLSLFDELHQRLPELDRQSYVRMHRPRLEYLYGEVYSIVVRDARREFTGEKLFETRRKSGGLDKLQGHLTKNRRS